jgi:hypothetical protein
VLRAWHASAGRVEEKTLRRPVLTPGVETKVQDVVQLWEHGRGFMHITVTRLLRCDVVRQGRVILS